MEQTSLGLDNAVLTDNDKIKSALEYELSNSEASKFLRVESNKDGSISIKAISAFAAKIKFGKKASYIEVKDAYIGIFKDCEIMYPKNGLPRVMVSNINDVIVLMAPLSEVYMKALAELAGDPVGCCHRYVECSDARQCQHPDYLTSLACAYKKNLDEGRIFYGKNKNI